MPPPPIAGVATSITAFVGRTAMGPTQPTRCFSLADFQALFGRAPDHPLKDAVADFFANGGHHAVIVRIVPAGAALEAGDLIGTPETKTGLHALDEIGLFNLVCIPPDRVGEPLPPGVLAQAAQYCTRRGAMLIIDPPAAWAEHAATGGFDLIRPDDLGIAAADSRNCAVYFPNSLRSTADGEAAALPPCGAIAGIFARTDATQGVWKAPAGLAADVRGAAGLALAVNEQQAATLNPLGINLLRKFSPDGPVVVWGARTLRGADALADDYKYVPVRRLALYVRQSIVAGIGWAVFEPNAAPLWGDLRRAVGTFLHDLWRQGAFAGGTPAASYGVTCDATTTTQDDIDQGIVNIEVRFAPLRPAEFVVIRIGQRAGQPAPDCG